MSLMERRRRVKQILPAMATILLWYGVPVEGLGTIRYDLLLLVVWMLLVFGVIAEMRRILEPILIGADADADAYAA